MCNKSCTKNITVHATLMRSMKYTVYCMLKKVQKLYIQQAQVHMCVVRHNCKMASYDKTYLYWMNDLKRNIYMTFTQTCERSVATIQCFRSIECRT